MRVLPLKGLKSVWALNAYATLVFGLAVEQAGLGQSYDVTFGNFEKLDAVEKEKQLRHALQIVNLQKDDMLNLLSFAVDVNGIPYDKKNLDSADPLDLLEAMLCVCMKLSELKPRTLPEDVKKNCPPLA